MRAHRIGYGFSVGWTVNDDSDILILRTDVCSGRVMHATDRCRLSNRCDRLVKQTRECYFSQRYHPEHVVFKFRSWTRISTSGSDRLGGQRCHSV